MVAPLIVERLTFRSYNELPSFTPCYLGLCKRPQAKRENAAPTQLEPG